jgi:hypothetical protein
MEFGMAVKMIALRRCYVPSLQGEFEAYKEFDAVDEREAKRLERRRLAKVVPVGKQAPRQEPKPSSEPDPLDAARSKYRTSTGRDPDMRWGLARIESELSIVPTPYGRRDMQAGEN